MKLELKKIKTNLSFSRETICFRAELYADGKKVADVENDGNGGENFARFVDDETEKNVRGYALSLPPTEFEGLQLKSCLDFVISDLINEHLKEKETAKNKKIALKEKKRFNDAGFLCVQMTHARGLLWFGVKNQNDVETYSKKMIEKHKMKDVKIEIL